MSLASLPTARYTSDTATSCTRAWFSVFRSSLSWLLHKLADPRHNPVTELVSQTLTYYSRHVFPPRGFFLLVISNRQALRWILSEQRMAFSPSRNKEPDTLFQDDKLVLYTTRGCFHSPARDRGRLIGTATIASPPRALQSAVVFGNRIFDRGCALRIDRLVPADRGPELANLVERLGTFPGSWHSHIRRALVPLNEQDFTVLDESLSEVDIGREVALPTYLNKIQARE